jgi:hypothetical protein
MVPPRWILAVILLTATVVPVQSDDPRAIKVIVAGTEAHLTLATAWLAVDPLTDPGSG